MKFYCKIFLLLLCFSLGFASVYGQVLETTDSAKTSQIIPDTVKEKIVPIQLSKGKSIKISGTIKDPSTEEFLPYATVMFAQTSVGTRSDEQGKFEFNLKERPSDTLMISMMGYKKYYVPLDNNKTEYVLKIELERSTQTLKEMVIRYNPNPGLTLIKKVIKNKAINNFDKAKNYTYEVYNKLELDISRIPKNAFKDKGLLKDFSFIKNYIDTTTEEKPFLPLFLTETISDYYFQTNPKKTLEIIKGSRISGYKNQSVSQYLGGMYQNINIYDNDIPIFDVGFVSPISNSAPLFYNYTILDTISEGDSRQFKLFFEPKRKGDHTFRGEIFINDKDWAVRKVSMEITGDQQINWIQKVNLVQEFELFADTLWFLVKDKFYVDFIASKKEKNAGFIGRKTTSYRNIIINQDFISDTINRKEYKESIITRTEAVDRDENYWNQVRHQQLTKNEKAIYQMIDTIQSLPVYNKYYNTLYLLSTGIKEVGPFEFGSLYNSFSMNPVEGNRFRFSMGTTPKLFKDIYINGYVAYGTLDKRWKFMGNMLWLLDRSPRRYINIRYKKDVDNSLSYYDDNAGSLDNIFNTIGRKKGVPWKLVFIDQKRIEFFNEFHNGFKQMLSFEHKITTPYSPLPGRNIFRNTKGEAINQITSSEIGLELRFSYLEKFIEGNYWRTSIGTKYPSVRFYTGLGLSNVFKSDYKYVKLRFSISDYQPIPSAGTLYYNVFAGKIIGNVPYLLLEIHPGNEFYYYNGRTFNMMNRFEYLSDSYVGAIVEHSLGSFFFKYIPYLDKAKLRTFWNAKAVYGSLSNENILLNYNKGFEFQSLVQSPYVEVGTGVENILRFLRIDFVWRVLPVSRLNDSPAKRFGVFGSAKFAF